MSTVLITGASRGIGLALVRLYAARGDTVVAACRERAPALDDLGVRVADGIDVGDDGVGAALTAALDRLEIAAVDVIINNAGVLSRETLGDLALDRVRRQLEINSLGPLRVTLAVLPRMSAGGKIAIITSRMGSIADNTSGGSYGYRMSKAAVNMAGVSLAHDLAGREIAVVILHPGYVKTGMTGGMGHVAADESARGLAARIDGLTLATTGRFLHAQGDPLPW